MNWLKKLLGKEKQMRVYITDERTPEQEVMWQEQLRIRALLGFEEGDHVQNWLRMHQILLDHETRLTALESKK
jgi:hypothetical protein